MPHLLIVEDQSGLRDVLKSVFEDTFSVRTARDGFEAMEIMATWQPDVVITDYAMPGMTGMEMVRSIAKIENRELKNKSETHEGPLTPTLSPLSRSEGEAGEHGGSPLQNTAKFILLSACLTDEIREEAGELGVAACVDKPFDLEELRGLVDRLAG